MLEALKHELKDSKGSAENTSTRESWVVIHAQAVLEGNIPNHDASRVAPDAIGKHTKKSNISGADAGVPIHATIQQMLMNTPPTNVRQG